MFLSSIKSAKQIETINMEYIHRSLSSQEFTIIKQKNKDLQAGLNIYSFILQKNNINMVVFVFRIGKNQFICAGYHHGKIVKEKQIKYQSDIPSTLSQIFRQARPSPDDQPILFDLQLQVMQDLCERTQKKEKNVNNFTQEVKTSKEYEHLKSMQKNIYQKVINDSTKLLQNKDSMKVENDILIDPLLRVEECKQSLQTAIMAFQEENAYLTNAKARVKEQLELIRDNSTELNSSNLNEKTFEDYLSQLTKIKELQLKQKYLIG